MLSAQSTMKEYTRAEGNFHKEIYSWRDQQGRNKTRRTEWESRELSGGFMESNTVEKAIKTEVDTRTEKKKKKKSGQARLVYVTWRWALRYQATSTKWVSDTTKRTLEKGRKTLYLPSVIYWTDQSINRDYRDNQETLYPWQVFLLPWLSCLSWYTKQCRSHRAQKKRRKKKAENRSS